MRTSILLALFVAASGLWSACGSSQGEGAGTAGAGSSGTEEGPIVIDPPPRTAEGQVVVGADACTTDADCVPAACCHASACVGRANAPACGDAVCTTDCRSGTIDCGGGCLCQEGRCAARLWELEAPAVQ